MDHLQKITDTLFVFRDDLFPHLGGGNKARKMMSLHPTLLENKYTAIVTTGGVQSNHCRAVALYAQKYEIPCTLVVHGTENRFATESGNAKLVRNTGVNTIFCEPEQIADSMDSAMVEFRNQGYNPYYLYGGGHTLEGSEAYISLLDKIVAESGIIPDYIFLPTGTGSTHAGILAGVKNLRLNTQVIGISIGRPRHRAEDSVKSIYTELCEAYDINGERKDVIVNDSFLFGGYEKTNESLDRLVSTSLLNLGFLMDTTYTGKAFFGMKELLKYYPKNKIVLFWNTGGQFNYFAK